MTVFHLSALYAMYFFSWKLLLLAVVMRFLQCIGVGIGYHRLGTHNGFSTYKPIEYGLILLGGLAVQGGFIDWATRHRIHHAETDQEGDLHSPREGFFWAHIGWMLVHSPESNDPLLRQRYAPRIIRQRFYVMLNKVWWLPTSFLGGAFYLFGGLPMLLWGAVVPVVIGWHSTWCVNSVCHLWGSRLFDTPDQSRNNLWVAIITLGEGWHNNHHENQSRARHGILWYQLDPNWIIIWIMEKLKLVRNVKAT